MLQVGTFSEAERAAHLDVEKHAIRIAVIFALQNCLQLRKEAKLR